MDETTVSAYDKDSESISDLHHGLIPYRLYDLVLSYFKRDKKTLDIGCGSGRDTAWLSSNGFDVLGIDASFGMLDQAKRKHPDLVFEKIKLPGLAEIPDDAYYNVLCSAVFMHLDYESLGAAANNIVRIMREGGILLLSFRGTKEKNKRENGKLYEKISCEDAIMLFCRDRCELLFYESTVEVGRGHVWHTFVFRKLDSLAVSDAISV